MLMLTQRPCLPPPCPGSKMLAGLTVIQPFIDDIVWQLIHAVEQDYWSLIWQFIRASTFVKLRNGAVHRFSLSICVFCQNFIHPQFHNMELLVRHRFCEFIGVKIAFIIAHTRHNVVVLFGTLKVQSFMLTEVRDCDLLIVVTCSTFLKRKDMLKEKSS